jgi:putative endopeptidase
MKFQLGGALAALTLSACAVIGVVPKSGPSGIERHNFDPGVRMQDDLYRAVNGTWLARAQIPADKANYGAFTALDDRAQQAIREIVEDTASRKHRPGTEEQKIADLYNAFMDEARLENLGIAPLKSQLAAIDAIQAKSELSALMPRLVRMGVNVPLVPFVHQDNKNSAQYIGDLTQAGLGLPDRDYYLLDEPKFTELRAQYQAHVEKMLGLAGIADASRAAAEIVALETSLARAQWDKVQLRDPEQIYNKFAAGKLKSLTREIDWNAFLASAGFQALPAVIVSQPSYVKALGREIARTDLSTWKRYFKWRLISNYAPMLSRAFSDENFGFYGRTLNGIPAQKPRWKRGIGVIQHANGNPDSPSNEALGEALGKLYVARHFPPQHKARMEKMVQNLLKAYEQEFPTLEWMSPKTQRAAAVKLSKFRYKIGYPDQWRDFGALEIRPGDLVGNVMRLAAFDYDREVKKLGGPVQRHEWGMAPQMVNAGYDPEQNDIIFPAAILQPPFFNADAEDAVNYGGIGAVIGHEISHGFDDQGSQFDGDGNLRSWWTKADRQKFEARAAQLAAQYDQYEPVKGYRLNGKFTLGENIADLGGLTIAHKAYLLSLGGKPAPVIDGLAGDQRLFIGWAQVWRRVYREENLINRTKTDPHSPSEYRVNGVVINVPAFYPAFGVTAKDKLYKPEAERIRIW